MESEKTYSCRLNKDESKYITSHWDGKFSDFVHNSIKNEKKLTKGNKTKNLLQSTLSNVVLLGFGALFIFYGIGTSNFNAFIISFLLGVFFMVSGLFSIFIEVKNRWKMSS